MPIFRARPKRSSATAGSAAAICFVRDADGYYIHQGRSDELLKVAGSVGAAGRARRARRRARLRSRRRRACRWLDADGLERLALFRDGARRRWLPRSAATQEACERRCRAARSVRSGCAQSSGAAAHRNRQGTALQAARNPGARALGQGLKSGFLFEASHGSRIPLWTPPALPVAGSSDSFPVRRIFCVGRNYAEHQKEMGGDGRETAVLLPEERVRARFRGAATVHYPAKTSNYHYETELVVALAQGRTPHRRQARQRSHLRLRRRLRHDAPRPAAVGQGPWPAVGLRQELRRVARPAASSCRPRRSAIRPRARSGST